MGRPSVKFPLILFIVLAYVSFFTPWATEARRKPQKHPKYNVMAPSPAPQNALLAPVPAPGPSFPSQLEMLGCGKTCFTTFCDWPCNHCCENNNTCCLDPRVQGLEEGQPIPPMPPLGAMCGSFCRDSNDCGPLYCTTCSNDGVCITEQPFPDNLPPSELPIPLPSPPRTPSPAPSLAPLSAPLASVPAPGPSFPSQLEMLGCGKTCFTTFCDWPCNHCCENNNTCCLDPRVQGLEEGQPIPPMPPLGAMCGSFCRDSNDCGVYCTSCSTDGVCITEQPLTDNLPPSELPIPLPSPPRTPSPAPSLAPPSAPLAPVPAPGPSSSDQLAMLGCGKTCYTTYCDWPCNHCCVNNNTCCLDPRVQGLEPGQPIPPSPPVTYQCGGFCIDSNDCGWDCSACSINGTCVPEESFPDYPPFSPPQL